MVDHTIKTRLLLRPIRSPIGTVRIGGVNQGGFGIGSPPGPRRTLDCYSFVQILNGHGYYADKWNPPTPVKKGDVVLYFPGQPHTCATYPGEFWDELWFEFEGPVFDLMRKTDLINPRRPLYHTRNCADWFRRIFQITPPIHLRHKTPPQVIVSRFATVLTELLTDSDAFEDAPAEREEWIDTACQMLSTHETSPGLEPAVVARKLGFTYETFRKKFRAAMGFSPGCFHLDSRIDRAAALLHQGRLTVKEIAAELQFCDEFYFSRCFKRRFGQSPRAFRQRVRGG